MKHKCGAKKGQKFSKEHKNKLSEAHKGKIFSEEHKNKLSLAHLGKSWGKHSLETRNKMRESNLANPNRVFRDTKIELAIEAELIKRNINYQKQVPLCKIAIVDFYLPEYRIVIQADGDYWHNLPDRKERDSQQDAVLTFNGFNVHRFWEHEINESVAKCINKIFNK